MAVADAFASLQRPTPLASVDGRTLLGIASFGEV